MFVVVVVVVGGKKDTIERDRRVYIERNETERHGNKTHGDNSTRLHDITFKLIERFEYIINGVLLRVSKWQLNESTAITNSHR